MKSRFAFIDALRGFASLAVVLYHAAEGHHIDHLPAWIRSSVSYGHLGVPVFFVISGFVISHSLRDIKMTPRNLVIFIARRSIRLDPPYWIAIITAVGFSILASRLVPGRQHDTYSAAELGAHVLYLQTIFGFAQINPVFWTLTYEIQFYIAFAFLLMMRSRIAFVIAILIALRWPLGFGSDEHGLFIDLWYCFLLGVGSYWGLREREYRLSFLIFASIVLGACAVRGDLFGVTCAVTSLVIFLVGLADRLDAFGAVAPIQFAGAISYSLYLIHNPITGAAFRVSNQFLPATPVAEAFSWALSIMACISAAWLLFVLVERPCMILAKLAVRRPKMVSVT